MEFIENEFKPTNETLKDLKKKILDAGLSFHPFLAMNAINKEVERQAVELVTNHFKGMRIEMLGKCNAEIKEFADAEEARYQAFMQSQAKDMSPMSLVSDTEPVTELEATPIIKTKKKK